MSSNRSLQTSLVRSNSLTALAAGLLSLLLTFLGCIYGGLILLYRLSIGATLFMSTFW